jgi:GYF domain 2
MSTWFYSRNGQQSGPVTSSELEELITQGQLKPNDLVRLKGMEEWLLARFLVGVQWPCSPPLPPADPHALLPATQAPKSRMSGCKIRCGVIVIIVFFVILILGALAIPGFLPSRKMSQMNCCISNLKQLEGAREVAVLAGIKNPCMADLCGATAYIKVTLVCPATKAVYTVPADPVATFVCPNPNITGDPEFTHSLYK